MAGLLLEFRFPVRTVVLRILPGAQQAVHMMAILLIRCDLPPLLGHFQVDGEETLALGQIAGVLPMGPHFAFYPVCYGRQPPLQ